MKNYNVILILLDGARIDRLPVSYGLKKLVTKGTLFSQMIAAAPYTVASIHSLFTGLYATTNGVNCYNNM